MLENGFSDDPEPHIRLEFMIAGGV